jgi:hypothetical protein
VGGLSYFQNHQPIMVPFSMQERGGPLESESVEERILLRKSCSIEWKVP